MYRESVTVIGLELIANATLRIASAIRLETVIDRGTVIASDRVLEILIVIRHAIHLGGRCPE